MSVVSLTNSPSKSPIDELSNIPNAFPTNEPANSPTDKLSKIPPVKHTTTVPYLTPTMVTIASPSVIPYYNSNVTILSIPSSFPSMLPNTVTSWTDVPSTKQSQQLLEWPYPDPDFILVLDCLVLDNDQCGLHNQIIGNNAY